MRSIGAVFWRRHPDLNRGIADLQSTALPLGYGAIWSGRRGSNSLPPPWQGGALPDELRPHLWCPRSESNQRHADFQSAALPTELQGQTYAVANDGGNNRARTCDPLLVRQMLSQLSYAPMGQRQLSYNNMVLLFCQHLFSSFLNSFFIPLQMPCDPEYRPGLRG